MICVWGGEGIYFCISLYSLQGKIHYAKHYQATQINQVSLENYKRGYTRPFQQSCPNIFTGCMWSFSITPSPTIMSSLSPLPPFHHEVLTCSFIDLNTLALAPNLHSPLSKTKFLPLTRPTSLEGSITPIALLMCGWGGGGGEAPIPGVVWVMLNLSTNGTLDLIILCGEGRPMHCRILSIPGHTPLEAGSTNSLLPLVVSQLPGIKSQLQHSLILCLWVNYPTSMCLDFLIYRVLLLLRTIIISAS